MRKVIMFKFQSRALIIGLATTLTAGTAAADVTMKQRIEVQAGGAMSMMNSTSYATTSLSGDKARSETRMEAKSGMMGRLMKNMDSTNITRLDRELIWTLVPDKQQYSELSFEQMRAQLARSMEQLESMQESGSSALPVNEEGCEWSQPVLNVSKTGEKAKFAGVKTEQHVISVNQTCTDRNTGKACEMIWTLENWMAKRMPGDDEMLAFQKAVAEKMGTDELMSQAQGMSAALLTMFAGGWGDILKESEDLKGYPLKTVMQLEMGGESCTTNTGQTMAMDDVWGNAANTGLNAATNSAAHATSSAIGSEVASAAGNSVGGSVAGAAVGAASRELVSGMFNKFKKKKKPEPAAAATAEQAAAAAVALFRIETEVTSINDDSVSSSQFEVPAGWKKVNAPSY
jgi:hypothetical protein